MYLHFLFDFLSKIRLEILSFREISSREAFNRTKIKIYLAVAIGLVGELDFGKGDGLLHPVCSEVGTLGVEIDGARWSGFGFPTCCPLSIHVLPSASTQNNTIAKRHIQTTSTPVEDH